MTKQSQTTTTETAERQEQQTTVEQNKGSSAVSEDRSHHSKWIYWALTTASLVGAALASFYTLQTKQTLLEMEANYTQTIHTALTTLKKQQTQTVPEKEPPQETTQWIETNQRLEAKQTELQAELNALAKKLENGLNQNITQQQSWQLNKARYYLELAAMNVEWSRDQHATLLLLQKSLALLNTSTDPQLDKIKQALQQDIDSLQTQPALHLVKILQHLSTLQTQINQLRFKPTTKDLQPKTTGTTWQEQVQTNLSFLEKLVIIRHDDQTTNPILSPLYQELCREQISLDLQKAQWAVLQGNSAIYHQTLAKLTWRIQRNFSHETPETNSFLKAITVLQAQSIVAKKLPLTALLEQLQTVIDNSNNSPPPTATTKQSNNIGAPKP